MSSVWQKGSGDVPCGMSDLVDVRYADGEESGLVTAGGLPWATIVEWRYSEPFASIRAAYIEGFAHGYGGEETYAEAVAVKNFSLSQARDDAFEASFKIGSAYNRKQISPNGRTDR